VALLWSVASLQSVSAREPVIENPVWLEEPNAAAFRENYPSQAADQAVEGFATIECFVRLDNRLDCSVTAEGPASWGFGDAALAISRTFRVGPARVDGVAVEGGRIRRTIRFVLPETDWRDQLPPEFRAYADSLAPPELPTWAEAPTSSMVVAATPEAARTVGTQGRGELSCRVAPDRRLNCEPLLEMPRGSGFANAAMALAPHFRIVSGDQDFISRHTSEPFILPISFNSPPQLTPVNRHYAGLGPLNLPPLGVYPEAMPERARAAGIRGSAVALCTLQPELAVKCEVESETPHGWDIGQFVVDAVESLPSWPVESGLIPGDQLRVTFLYAPN
jgi:TonB family protein